MINKLQLFLGEIYLAGQFRQIERSLTEQFRQIKRHQMYYGSSKLGNVELHLTQHVNCII